MLKQISSLQNERIKHVVKLGHRRYRDAQRLTVVEGEREVSRALQNGIKPHEAFFCPQLLTAVGCQIAQTLQKIPNLPLYEVTPEVFAKMAYREESGGLLLTIPYFVRSLTTLSVPSPAFLAIIEDAEKPGNLGAILRTADAAGVTAVIVCQNQSGTDLHNPNVIRASLGTTFTVPMATAPTSQVIRWLQEQAIRMIAALPDASQRYTDTNLTGSIAIVMGSEARGLQPEWLNVADEQVSIPMFGCADSLNLATATALLLYEGVRQRNIDKSSVARTKQTY